MSTRAFGYTVSELGLILAFLFMAQMLRDRPTISSTDELISVKRADYDKIVSDRDSLKAEADSLRRHLRSPQLPSCIAKKKATGPICSVVIAGADTFILENELLSLKALREKYAAELTEAKACECVHTIVARYRSDLSTEAYDRALARLEETFYVKRMGVVP